ncbi:ribonuclease P protein component [Paludibacter sp.]|uniref:ribonuclease P protein component n=1 Tax=Paludibacter sp. TaxID=1898105 RepID=UPI001355D1EE|nr:ribonuclease P protein component [Paludibacter sp.]MTK54578.1 ribonuclease P protein component [Paludibacter sp.]
MSNTGLSFPKKEHLTGEIRVKRLFTEGQSFLVYPLRVVFLPDEPRGIPLQALFSVPKRRFKRANKRNLLKRRMREAFRLHKSSLTGVLTENARTVDVAFTYIANEPIAFSLIERKMIEALNILKEKAV